MLKRAITRSIFRFSHTIRVDVAKMEQCFYKG